MPDNWWQDKWSKMTIWLAFSCGRKTSATSQPKTSPFKLVWNRLEPLFLITPSLRSWWVFPWTEEDQTQTHLEPSRPKHNLWTWRCPRSEYWPSFVLEIPEIFLFLLSLLLFLSRLDMAVFFDSIDIFVSYGQRKIYPPSNYTFLLTKTPVPSE